MTAGSLFSLDDRVAIVSGASRGIGRAMARALAEAGARVVACARDEAALRRLCSETPVAGAPVLAVPADLASPGAPERLVQRALDEHGRIDVVVNAAGANLRGPSLDVEPADWDAVVDLNLRTTFLVTQAAARAMARRRTGSVINVASLSSFVGIRGAAAYGASKGGVAALTRALALEWAELGIRVNAIAPGMITTAMTQGVLDDPDRRASLLSHIPMGRLGEPADCAGAAIFLASQASAYVTGHILAVDGGYLVA